MPNRDKNIFYGISCAIIGSANRILSAKTNNSTMVGIIRICLFRGQNRKEKRLPQFIDNFIAER